MPRLRWMRWNLWWSLVLARSSVSKRETRAWRAERAESTSKPPCLLDSKRSSILSRSARGKSSTKGMRKKQLNLTATVLAKCSRHAAAILLTKCSTITAAWSELSELWISSAAAEVRSSTSSEVDSIVATSWSIKSEASPAPKLEDGGWNVWSSSVSKVARFHSLTTSRSSGVTASSGPAVASTNRTAALSSRLRCVFTAAMASVCAAARSQVTKRVIAAKSSRHLPEAFSAALTA
mmetsp:Transcript_16535/g.50023  ORF Transcript_16535/g.50023 Transcript_16535/m.50023 type:complete len:236 (-) Transcript_16535:615-1322(-)